MERSNFKVTHVGEIRRGTSKKNGEEWQAQNIVLEEVNKKVQYPERMVATLRDADVDRGLRVGERIECTPFINAHEHDGHYYNHVSLKDIVPIYDEDVRPLGYEK